MNTPTKWTTTVRADDGKRGTFWVGVFGIDTLPVISVIPQWAVLPGKNGPQLVYMLDLRAITVVQRVSLIAALAEKFGLPIEQVAEELDEGVPILADDVSVTSSDVGQIMLLLDGDGELEDWWCEVDWGGDDAGI